MGSLTLELAINLYESALFYYLISHCLHFKYNNYKKYICLITDFTVTTLCNFFLTNIMLSLCIIFATQVTLAFLFTQNTFSEKIFWGGCYTILTRISENIVLLSFDWIIGNAINLISEASPLRYGSIVIYLLLLTALIFFAVHIRERSLTFPVSILLVFLLLILISICSTEALILNIIHAEAHTDKAMLPYLYFIGFSLLALLILPFILVTYNGILHKRNLDLRLSAEQQKTEQAQYQMLNNSNKLLRAWKHEYINHLQTICGLLKMERLAETEQYTKALIDEINLGTNTICTGSCALDAILSIKQFEAQEAGTAFTYELLLPKIGQIPLNEVLLSSLLGNMLDNAIEASAKTENAFIHLIMKAVQSSLLIELSNSSTGKYQYNPRHELVTTKAGTDHGIGLKRISGIIKEAGGLCEFTPEPDRFMVTIILPLKA